MLFLAYILITYIPDNVEEKFIGYAGSLIGGFIAFVGVVLTIKYYKNQDQQSRIETEKREYDSYIENKNRERLSIMPYLKVIDCSGSEKNLTLNFKYTENNVRRLFGNVLLENVGNGSSINIKLEKFNDIYMIDPDCIHNYALCSKSSMNINLNLDIDKEFDYNSNNITLLIRHEDLLGNIYEQEFEFIVNRNYYLNYVGNKSFKLVNQI